MRGESGAVAAAGVDWDHRDEGGRGARGGIGKGEGAGHVSVGPRGRREAERDVRHVSTGEGGVRITLKIATKASKQPRKSLQFPSLLTFHSSLFNAASPTPHPQKKNITTKTKFKKISFLWAHVSYSARLAMDLSLL